MSIPGQQAADALISRLGVHVDPDLLVLALTHRSFAYEAGGLPTNERLEFLGDSVLGIVVTDRLYHAHPDLPEGELAKMRAACVSQRALAVVARDIGLGPCILLGKGEKATGGNDKDSILCDAFEAILGAVYLTHGIDTAREVVLRLVGPSLEAAATSGVALDWKTSLQEACAERGLGSPVYEVTGEGPDHARRFTATVLIAGEPKGSGTGTAKKHAEQDAAAEAYAVLTDA
ncbi:ribonuclease III [Demequina sp. SYSU T00192]|uniref:Ribonuclease 3 n=1 Tax=Demequina litoralis TaxID=3051660 RepID=A0ABT8GC71_9MICO|nr:ribonuclease III [Demequina sp. SYSU T00192]MDN4476735.1 ribonuclease III [Demequina sp. SYSU T00192]